MNSTQPRISDIFTFDPDYAYQITLVTGLNITGRVVEVYDNGIVLDNAVHIPQSAIACFQPVALQKNETTPNFMV